MLARNNRNVSRNNPLLLFICLLVFISNGSPKFLRVCLSMCFPKCLIKNLRRKLLGSCFQTEICHVAHASSSYYSSDIIFQFSVALPINKLHFGYRYHLLDNEAISENEYMGHIHKNHPQVFKLRVILAVRRKLQVLQYQNVMKYWNLPRKKCMHLAFDVM